MSKQQPSGQVVPAGDGDPRRHFTQLEQVSALVGASEAEPDMGFMARLLALCSLPRTNPGNRKEYIRRNSPNRASEGACRSWHKSRYSPPRPHGRLPEGLPLDPRPARVRNDWDRRGTVFISLTKHMVFLMIVPGSFEQWRTASRVGCKVMIRNSGANVDKRLDILRAF